MKKKNKSKIILLLASALCLIIIVGIILGLRFTNAEFRYNFDVTFNCDDIHYSYLTTENGTEIEEATLPLPASTTLAFRHSDSAATYYSKLTYEEFLESYRREGYKVEENAVYIENCVFLISDVSDEMDGQWKYHFIDIKLDK